jgi:hypothetical protein
MSNNLSESTSLYLQQHSGNPVHWQMWNEGLMRSNTPGEKLRIISIGYSSCHWCHVMEEESFEDEEVAALMNEYFVSIKVDRETHPDIDARYMSALQLMTGTGGWPLNIIALPDGTPVYGGTYFSKKDWTSALEQVAQLWKNEPEQVLNYGEQMRNGLQDMLKVSLKTKQNTFQSVDFDDVVAFWMRTIDPVHGGPNGAPKFPLPSNFSFLLDYAIYKSDQKVLEYALLSLEKMALGGIYDWLHGGITRYSTDRFWKVPHFEKMLYDNGQMMGLYARAFRYSKNPLFLETAQGISEFLERDMKLGSGLFASALDADSPTPGSPREEGGYYTWSAEELESIAIPERSKFNEYFDITPYSAWEGKYILHRTEPLDKWAIKWGLDKDQAHSLEQSWKRELQSKSTARIHTHPKPIRDPKALCTWNALLVLGWYDLHLADPEGGFDDKTLALIHSMRTLLIEGRTVLHEINGQEGYLDDYATMGLALLKGYALTGDESYCTRALEIAHIIDQDFVQTDSPFYRYNRSKSEDWKEVMEIEDNVIPSANSFVAHFFHELGTYTGQMNWSEKSRIMVESIHGKVFKHGQNFSHWLNLALSHCFGAKELVTIGEAAKAALGAITATNYRPNTMYLSSTKVGELPLTCGRPYDKTRYFICKHGACNLPTDDSKTAKQLWME